MSWSTPAASGCAAESDRSSRGTRFAIPQPDLELGAIELGRRARPALLGPAREVVVDRRDPGLDGGPERPADVRHDHLQPHPGEQGRGGLAEVGRAELDDPVVVEAQLLAGVAQLEGRIVVAAVLVVDDPQPLAVVEVVLGQQVVVAGDRGQGMGGEGRLDARHPVHPRSISSRNHDRTLVDDGQVALGEPEHVEVVPKAGSGVEPAERVGDAARHPGLLEGGLGHRARAQPFEDEHVPVGQGVQDPGRHAGRGRGSRVVQLVGAVDRQELRRRAPGMRTKWGVPSTSTR